MCLFSMIVMQHFSLKLKTLRLAPGFVSQPDFLIPFLSSDLKIVVK